MSAFSGGSEPPRCLLCWRVLPCLMSCVSGGMEETVETLQKKMEDAARALDFEEAKRCRDRISLMRGGANATDAAKADFARLERQQPGSMGLGTGQPRMKPPQGWKRPRNPDPMTSGHGLRSKKQK